MPNYTKSFIYKIECLSGDPDYVYIGSTTQALSMRMGGHRANYKRYREGKYPFTSSFSVFDKYQVENCKITLISEVSCNSKQELEAIEGKYIREMNCINKYIPSGRIHKGREKDYKKEYMREYRQKKSLYQPT